MSVAAGDENKSSFDLKRHSPESPHSLMDVKKKNAKVTKRGLAYLMSPEINQMPDLASVGAAGVYSKQINICRQQKKEVRALVAKQISAMEFEQKENKAKEALELVKCDLEIISESVVPSPNFDLPQNYPTRGKKGGQSKKLENLLRNLEQQKIMFQKDKAVPNDLDDILNSEDTILLEDDDYAQRNIILRIQSHAAMLRFNIITNETFEKVFKSLAKMHNIPVNRVLLTFKDNIIRESDTPNSIGLSIVDNIDFCIIDDESAEQMAKEEAADTKNTLLLKVQCKNFRTKVEIRIRVDDRMSKLMQIYAQTTGGDLGKLVFKFDGDLIEPDQTPKDLDLEDGFCIDALEQS